MSFLTKIVALGKDTSQRLIDELKKVKDDTYDQHVFDFAEQENLKGDDLSDLMYDLQKAGFHPKKPDPTQYKKRVGRSFVDTQGAEKYPYKPPEVDVNQGTYFPGQPVGRQPRKEECFHCTRPATKVYVSKDKGSKAGVVPYRYLCDRHAQRYLDDGAPADEILKLKYD